MTPQETRLHLDRIDALVRESVKAALDGDPEWALDLLDQASPHAADCYVTCSVLALTVLEAVRPTIGPGLIRSWPDPTPEATEPDRIEEENASFTAAFLAALGNGESSAGRLCCRLHSACHKAQPAWIAG